MGRRKGAKSGTAGGRRPRARLALLVATVLAVTLVASVPALSQEAVTITGVLGKPEVTTYQYGTYVLTDEATGATYALKGKNLDAYVGQRITVYGVPVPGYGSGEVEGGPPLLAVTRTDVPAPGATTGPEDLVAEGSEEPTAVPDPAGTVRSGAGSAEEAAQGALRNATLALEAAGTAEGAVQQAAESGDPQTVQEAEQAAEEARQASDAAQTAAQAAQGAAALGDAPAAQRAAAEAQQASGAAQIAAQAAQQAARQVDGGNDGTGGGGTSDGGAYFRAVEAARFANSSKGKAAFAAEGDPGERRSGPEGAGDVDSKYGPSEDGPSEDGPSEDGPSEDEPGEITASGKESTNEDGAEKEPEEDESGAEDPAEDEVDPETVARDEYSTDQDAAEDTGGAAADEAGSGTGGGAVGRAGSNAASFATRPQEGGALLFLGAGALLLAGGVFVAYRVIR